MTHYDPYALMEIIAANVTDEDEIQIAHELIVTGLVIAKRAGMCPHCILDDMAAMMQENTGSLHR